MVEVASQTADSKLITAVAALPLHGMRGLCGEVVCANIRDGPNHALMFEASDRMLAHPRQLLL